MDNYCCEYDEHQYYGNTFNDNHEIAWVCNVCQNTYTEPLPHEKTETCSSV